MIRYNPALDGLRAVSVIAVVLYHAGAIGGGWIGVEVFFVISGFLITSLLSSEHERTGRIDLLAFWRRRARRLLPGIALLAAVAAVYLVAFESTRPLSTATRDMVGLLTYSSNWTAITGGGYWATFELPSPLRHAWSLAVEEQFYLVFPLVAAGLLRRRVFAPVLFVATVAAGVWQLVARDLLSIDRVYLGTDTRAFGLLAGASLAVILRRRPAALPARVAVAVGAGALAVLAVAAVVLGDATASTFGGPFQAVVAASVAIILAVHDPERPNPVSRGLSAAPLVHVGRWSYGIYLFHWPLLIAIEPRQPSQPWVLALVVLAITIPVAGASYRWFEHPIRRDGLGAFGGRRRAIALGSAGLLVAAGSLTVAGATNAAARPTVDDIAARAAPAAAPPDASAAPTAATTAPTIEPQAPAATEPHATTPTTTPTTTPPATTPAPVASAAPTTAPAAEGVVARPADRPLRLYVVGDSVGASIEQQLTPLAGELGIDVFSRAAGGCGYDRVRMQYFNQDFQPEQCLDLIAAWPQDVETFRPDAVLVAFGAWWGWYWNGAERTQCEADLAAHVQGLYDLALADLGRTGAPVFFMAPADWNGEAVGPPGIPDHFDCVRAVLADWSAGAPGSRIVDLHDLLCVDHDCASTVGGEPTRPDGVHFEGAAAPAVMVAMLDRMVAPPAGGWPDYGAIELP